MAITTRPFGLNAEGKQVTAYTMTNSIGASATVIEYGATLTSVIVPDINGEMADVVTGFDSMDGYVKKHGHMGEIVGRYGNRIGDATFTLDGVKYQLATNNGKNHLHGGPTGFGVRMWTIEPKEGKTSDSLVCHYVSADGEEGYPGNLSVTVTYTWNDACDLIIRYQATTDKPTLCNLTNHAYFNLAGHDHGTIDDHMIVIDADVITDVDEGLIPLGGYLPVAGTPFDLRDGVLLGDALAQTAENEQMTIAGGFDHNFVLRKGRTMGLAACVWHEESGRTMEVLTDLPGVQFYTANGANYSGGKDGVVYGEHCSLCLETQCFPDSPNNPQWPTTTLRPGEKYDTTTIYAFRINDEEEEY